MYCTVGSAAVPRGPSEHGVKMGHIISQLARFLAPTRLVRGDNNGQYARRVRDHHARRAKDPLGRHLHPTSSSCCNAMLRTSIFQLRFFA